MIDSGERPRLWTSTLSRPRWAIPITTSSAPAARDWVASPSIIGTTTSSPSIENIFWPRYAFWMKRSNWNTSIRRRRSDRFSSAESGVRCPPVSIISRSHIRCWCDERCSIW